MAHAADEQKLAELAIHEGFENVQGRRKYRLGIDARYVEIP